MAKSSRSLITVLVDRTGSMHSMRADAEGATNHFIEEQKAAPGKARIHLYDFDTQDSCNVVYEGKIGECPKYALEPRGGTPLYDAIGKAIGKADEQAKVKTYDHHFFVIVTDGEENSSREWTADAVKALIKEREDKGWTFIFLAANQSAFVGASVFAGTHMHDTNTIRNDGSAKGYEHAHSFASSSIAATRGGAKGVTYGGESTEAGVTSDA